MSEQLKEELEKIVPKVKEETEVIENITEEIETELVANAAKEEAAPTVEEVLNDKDITSDDLENEDKNSSSLLPVIIGGVVVVVGVIAALFMYGASGEDVAQDKGAAADTKTGDFQ